MKKLIIRIFIFFLSNIAISCMMASDNLEGSGLAVEVSDKFPVYPEPKGDDIFPLAEYPSYEFRFSTIDSTNAPTLLNFTLGIEPVKDDSGKFAKNIYKYVYDNSDQGLLITYLDSADFSGVYFIGYYDTTGYVFQQPELWVPQFPDRLTFWQVDSTTTRQVLDDNHELITDNITNGKTLSLSNEISFESHRTILVRETKGDTLSYFYFTKGVGLVGLEQVVGDRTISIGVLKSANLSGF